MYHLGKMRDPGNEVEGCKVLVVTSHQRVIVDSIKRCELTVAMDGNEDLMVDWLKPSQPIAACLDRPKGLNYVVL